MTTTHYNLLGKPEVSSKSCWHSCFKFTCITLVLLAFSGGMLYVTCFKPTWLARLGNVDSVTVDNGAVIEDFPPPPPHNQYAAVARYIMHVSNWASLATMSTHAGIEGYPFANVFSISDGLHDNSTGNPYFYLTSMELSVHDLEKDPRASLTATLAQSNYCKQEHLDPQDPLCAHVILTGEIVKIKEGSAEAAAAHEALFTRHPEMNQWPTDHGWFYARLAIRHIYLLDFFGGAKVIDPKDYFSASPYGNMSNIVLA